MQAFQIDLKTLLHIFARQKQHGLLQAAISSEKLHCPGARQLLHASLLLDKGAVQTCTIAYKRGEQVAEGQEALQLLLGAGVVEWQWKAHTLPLLDLSLQKIPGQQAITPANLRPSLSATSIPCRTLRSEEVLPTLSRAYRKILALVDGQRSIHKLADILALRDEDVMRALQTLQSWGLIS